MFRNMSACVRRLPAPLALARAASLRSLAAFPPLTRSSLSLLVSQRHQVRAQPPYPLIRLGAHARRVCWRCSFKNNSCVEIFVELTCRCRSVRVCVCMCVCRRCYCGVCVCVGDALESISFFVVVPYESILCVCACATGAEKAAFWLRGLFFSSSHTWFHGTGEYLVSWPRWVGRQVETLRLLCPVYHGRSVTRKTPPQNLRMCGRFIRYFLKDWSTCW